MKKPKTTRAKSKPRVLKPRAAGRSAHRINTIKSNGDLPESVAVPAAPVVEIPISEAMKQAVEALGPVTIDEDLAPGQLEQLSVAYEDVTRRQAASDKKAEEAKIAKKSLESAKDMLLELVRTFTHVKPLPLFDQKQADVEHQAMLEGGDVEGREGEVSDAGVEDGQW